MLIAFPIGFVIALVHAVVLGLPAYFLLRPLWRAGWAVAAIAGFVIGALPTALFILPSVGLTNGGLWTPLLAGLCGFLGGSTFYAVIRGAPADPDFDPAIWE